ncbi:MAG: DUF2115 domain-containing protein [Methanosphaera stadtmanae]|nr:DUF2115 domain-containing protein [Methanosphaera stadtmanae]
MTPISKNMSYNDLKKFLQKEIKKITLEQLYELSFHFNDDVKYLPREYKKKYTQSVLNVIISRYSSLKNDSNNYEGYISKEDFEQINTILSDKEDMITYTMNLIVVYATYFLKEPVHLPGTVFPGMVSVFTDGENYYCPVKKFHINNPQATCKYCIAKITDD